VDADSCRGIDWVSAVIVIVLIGIIVCVSSIAITSMGLDLAIVCCCWYWVRWSLVGDVDGNGVARSGIIVYENSSTVIGIIISFGSVAIIIFNIGRKLLALLLLSGWLELAVAVSDAD